MYLCHCLFRHCSSVQEARCSPCHPSHRSTCIPIDHRCRLYTVRVQSRNSGNLPWCSVFHSNQSRTNRSRFYIAHVRCIEDRIALDYTIRRTIRANSRKHCQRNARGDRNPNRIILKIKEYIVII